MGEAKKEGDDDKKEGDGDKKEGGTKEGDEKEDGEDGEDEREAGFQRRKAESDRETLGRATSTTAGAQPSPAPSYKPALSRAQPNVDIVDGFDIIDPLDRPAAARRDYVAAAETDAETKTAAAVASTLASPPPPPAVGMPIFWPKSEGGEGAAGQKEQQGLEKKCLDAAGEAVWCTSARTNPNPNPSPSPSSNPNPNPNQVHQREG